MRERTPLESERILLEVALQFGSTLDLDKLASLVVERMVDLLGAERALFVLFDQRGGIERAVVHNLVWEGPGHALPISQSVVSEVRKRRELVVVPDASSDTEFQAHQSVRALNLRFILAMPVQVRQDIVGVLYVDSRTRAMRELGTITDTLTALAKLVGTAVENARLFEEQAFRNVLLAQMVHEFRSPLTVIGSNAQMLQRPTLPPGLAVEIGGDIAATSAKMSQMIDTTLSLSRVDAGHHTAQPERVDITTLLENQINGLRPVASPLGLSFSLTVPPNLPFAHGFQDRVRIVISNLLFNALKHGASGSTIRVAVGLRGDPGPAEAGDRRNAAAYLFRQAARLQSADGGRFLEISVHNEGSPIPEDLRSLLFTMYARGADMQRGHTSTGIGLAIVEQCIRSLGGRVWVRSDAGFGTEFRFTLPTEAVPAASAGA